MAIKKIFFNVWNHAKVPQNTFFITPDVEKYLFYGHVSGGLEACENASKHGFNHSKRKKNIFFLVVWKHAFLTTPDVEKYLFLNHVSGVLEACANASKHVFNHSRR